MAMLWLDDHQPVVRKSGGMVKRISGESGNVCNFLEDTVFHELTLRVQPGLTEQLATACAVE